jgi:predicted nucleic acid-binding protein
MIINLDHKDAPITIVTPVGIIYITNRIYDGVVCKDGWVRSEVETSVKVSKTSDRNTIECYQPTNSGAEILVVQEVRNKE